MTDQDDTEPLDLDPELAQRIREHARGIGDDPDLAFNEIVGQALDKDALFVPALLELYVRALARATGNLPVTVLARLIEHALHQPELLAAAADQPWEIVRAKLYELSQSAERLPNAANEYAGRLVRRLEDWVAFHEAGHAVADVRQGCPPGIVSIVPKPGSHLGITGGEVNDRTAEELLLASYAGVAAEVEHGVAPDLARAHAVDDFELARGYCGEHDEAVWIDAARKFVRENWRAVEMVAAELLERPELRGEEVDILVEIADGTMTRSDLAKFRLLMEHSS